VRVAVLTLPSAKESFPAMPNPKPPPSKLTGWTDALKSLYFGIVGGYGQPFRNPVREGLPTIRAEQILENIRKPADLICRP